MIRTQIQLTEEQAQALKLRALREGKSIAEIIRSNLDDYLRNQMPQSPHDLRKQALEAVGCLHGPADLAENHDACLAEAQES